MKTKISETFIQDIFYSEKSNCKLSETEQHEYEVNVTWAIGKEMIVVRPGEIKSRSTYINQRSLPKDCDYVLIDIEEKNIFFIELKLSSDTSTALQVSEQLKAGEVWIEHLFFIMGIKNEYVNFSKFFIHSVYNARMRIKNKFLENDLHGVYKINGPNLNLIPIINRNY